MLAMFRTSVTMAAMSTTLAAATIAVDITTVGEVNGEPLLRYTYMVTGLDLLVNQELDIRFDPAVFETLSNPTGPAGFDILTFQPNTPPGAFGDLSALALFDFLAFNGAFTVDVILTGLPSAAPQPFLINQYTEQNGTLVFDRVVSSGSTLPPTSSDVVVPEPGTFVPAGLGFLVIGAAWAVRRRVVR